MIPSEAIFIFSLKVLVMEYTHVPVPMATSDD